jgi:hypothetical protein
MKKSSLEEVDSTIFFFLLSADGKVPMTPTTKMDERNISQCDEPGTCRL